MHKLISLFAALTFLAEPCRAATVTTPSVVAPISLSNAGNTYSQDFNSLASSGTSTLLPGGWQIFETGTGTAANGVYAAGTGSSNTGDTYSFGAAGSSERALGTLFSGSNTEYFGVGFQNVGTTQLQSLQIRYTGEEWRFGGSNGRVAPDRLDFQYSLDASSLNSGSWIDFDILDFYSPVYSTANTTITVGAKDGNSSQFQTDLSGTISGLNLAINSVIWFRWREFDIAPGSDDGLAIDNFSLTATFEAPVVDPPTGPPVPEPGTLALSLIGLVGAFGFRRRCAAK